MTENEITLIKLIHEHENSEKAFVTALEIIIEYLNLHEPSVSEPSVDSRESA